MQSICDLALRFGEDDEDGGDGGGNMVGFGKIPFHSEDEQLGCTDRDLLIIKQRQILNHHATSRCIGCCLKFCFFATWILHRGLDVSDQHFN